MADRILRAIISGDAAGAVSAFKETALSAEGAGGSIKKAGVEAGEGAEAGASKANTGLMGMASQLSNAIPLWGKLGIGVGVAVIGIGAAVFDMANKYDDSTAKMAANAGITIEQAKKVGEAFLTTGGQTIYSAQQMMEAYGPVSNQLGTVAGHALTAGESVGFMSQATTLAEASGQDLTTTTANLASVMQAFHQPLSAASSDIDVMFNSARAVNMPIADYTNSIEKLHSKLGDVGGSLPQLSTMFMDFAEHGLSGRTAMTTLTSATNSLLASNDKASAAYQKQNDVVDKDTAALNKLLSSHKATTAQIDAAKATLAAANADLETLSQGAGAMGLNIYNASGQFIGMQSVIEQLQPKLKGMSDAQRRTAEDALFGAGSFDKMDSTIMAGKSGWDTASAAVNKHGTAIAAAAVSTDTLSGKLDKAKTFVADLAVKFGQNLTHGLEVVGEWVNKAIDWFAKFLPGALNVVGAVFGVIFGVISAIVQRIVIVIQVAVGIVIPIIQTIATIFGVVFGIIAGVVGAIVSVIQAIIPPIAAVVGFIFNIFATTFHVISTVIGVEIGIVKAIITGIVDVVQAIAGPIGAIFSAIGGAIGTVFQGVSGVVQGIWNGVIGAIKGAINGVIGIINGVIGAIDAIQVHIHVGPVNLDWNGLQIGKVPTLDSGAIVSGPTFAALAMNSRPEVVAPLDELPGLMARRGGGGSVIQITQNFTLNGNDERLLAQVKQEVETNNDTLARTILARAA